MAETISNRMFVLGGSLIVNEHEKAVPSKRTVLREKTAIEYHDENREFFDPLEHPEAFIALSGARDYHLRNHPKLKNFTEVDYYSQAFAAAGIPAVLHEGRKDPTAVDTARNMINAVRFGFFEPASFSAESPLVIPIAPEPGRRVGAYWEAMGGDPDGLYLLETGEAVGRNEDYLYARTLDALSGITPGSDVASLDALEARVDAMVADIHHPDNAHYLQLAA